MFVVNRGIWNYKQNNICHAAMLDLYDKNVTNKERTPEISGVGSTSLFGIFLSYNTPCWSNQFALRRFYIAILLGEVENIGTTYIIILATPKGAVLIRERN